MDEMAALSFFSYSSSSSCCYSSMLAAVLREQAVIMFAGPSWNFISLAGRGR